MLNTNQDYKLDKEEQEILEYLESGNYESVENLEEYKQALQQMAARTLREMRKDNVITLRINSVDLARLKLKAAKQGLKYQTYITMLLHQAAQD
jgi:predicted DNA binding CopG/RHH family protein